MKIIKKLITIGLAVLLCLSCATAGNLGDKKLPRVAILPFMGTNADEGEMIATLLTNESEIQKNFTPILRTNIQGAFKKYQQALQKSLITQLTSVADLGENLEADFVVAGMIQSSKEYNFVFINIVDIKTRQMVAGDYIQFEEKEDIPSLLADIAKKIVTAPKIKKKNMLELAIWPFSMPRNEATAQEIEVLTQITAIEIINSGKYVVLPRTQQINDAISKKLFEPSAVGEGVVLPNLVEALNAKYILVGLAGSIGTKRHISMQITNLEDGQQVKGSNVEYEKINDCIKRIPLLVQVICGQMTETQKQRAFNQEKKGSDAAPKKADDKKKSAETKSKRPEKWAKIKGAAFRNHMDTGGYFQWVDGEGDTAGGGGVLGAHWSPLPFTVIGLEPKAGVVIKEGVEDPAILGSVSLGLGLVYPFTDNVKLFGDGLFEIGSFDGMNGMIAKNITPGFDAGLDFWFDKAKMGFDIKYRGTWFENNYLHSVGIGLLWLGGSSWKLR